MQQHPDMGAMPSKVSGTLQGTEQGGTPQGSQLPQSGCATAGQLHLAIGNLSEDSSPISPARGQPASALLMLPVH